MVAALVTVAGQLGGLVLLPGTYTSALGTFSVSETEFSNARSVAGSGPVAGSGAVRSRTSEGR